MAIHHFNNLPIKYLSVAKDKGQPKIRLNHSLTKEKKNENKNLLFQSIYHEYNP